MGLLLIALAFNTMSDLMNVKEHVSAAGIYILETIKNFLMGLWLIIAMSRKQNWARKTFITLNGILPIVVLTLLFFFPDESADEDISMLNVIVSFVAFLISVWCVCLCFSKDIRNVFLDHSRVADSKAVANRYHYIAYGAVYVITGLIFAGLHGDFS